MIMKIVYLKIVILQYIIKKNDIIRQINFINSKKELYKKIEINEITRYILFDFKDNLGGDYIIIKKLKFEGKILNDID